MKMQKKNLKWILKLYKLLIFSMMALQCLFWSASSVERYQLRHQCV